MAEEQVNSNCMVSLFSPIFPLKKKCLSIFSHWLDSHYFPSTLTIELPDFIMWLYVVYFHGVIGPGNRECAICWKDSISMHAPTTTEQLWSTFGLLLLMPYTLVSAVTATKLKESENTLETTSDVGNMLPADHGEYLAVPHGENDVILDIREVKKNWKVFSTRKPEILKLSNVMHHKLCFSLFSKWL